MKTHEMKMKEIQYNERDMMRLICYTCIQYYDIQAQSGILWMDSCRMNNSRPDYDVRIPPYAQPDASWWNTVMCHGSSDVFLRHLCYPGK